MKTTNSFKHYETSPLALGNPATMEPEVLPAGRNARVGSTADFDNSEITSAAVERIAHFSPSRLRTLLVPLDGSAFGERALPLAVKIAERTGSELRIVHVDTTFGHPYTRDRLVQDKIVCDYCVELEWQKRAYLERIAAQIRNESSVRVTAVLLNSRNVVAALLDAIGADVDLVIMAAYGKGLIRRWVRGSTAHELIHQAAVPVLIVGADGSFATPVSDRARRVLVAWMDPEAPSKRLDQHWRLAKSMRRNTSYCAWYHCQHSTVGRRPGMAAAHLMMDSERSNWRQLAGI